MKARVTLPPLVKCIIPIPIHTILLVHHQAVFIVVTFLCCCFSKADGEVADDAEASKFWEYFGGFGTISAQASHEDHSKDEGSSAQLYK